MSDIRYSIKDLENFTQIKAHTIRIWEQRYGLLDPKRTSTNIRYYNEEDLKKILNINLLYTSGYKISKIASLSEDEIIEASKELILEQETENQSEIDVITMNVLTFKGDKILQLLESGLKNNDIEQLYANVVLPILVKIGRLWQVNSVDIIHEHYFSNIFREFIITQIHELKIKPDPVKSAILYLNEHEEHEFSLLISHYILKRAGYTCHYFGQKVPNGEMKAAFSLIKPQIVFTSFTTKLSEKNFRKIEDELLEYSKSAQVIITGGQLKNFDFKFSKDLHHVKSIDQLKSLIA